MGTAFPRAAGASSLKDVTHAPPNKRNTGMVFQSHALWTHMNVHKNLAFARPLQIHFHDFQRLARCGSDCCSCFHRHFFSIK